jgi:hypothetical protein
MARTRDQWMARRQWGAPPREEQPQQNDMISRLGIYSGPAYTYPTAPEPTPPPAPQNPTQFNPATWSNDQWSQYQKQNQNRSKGAYKYYQDVDGNTRWGGGVNPDQDQMIGKDFTQSKDGIWAPPTPAAPQAPAPAPPTPSPVVEWTGRPDNMPILIAPGSQGPNYPGRPGQAQPIQPPSQGTPWGFQPTPGPMAPPQSSSPPPPPAPDPERVARLRRDYESKGYGAKVTDEALIRDDDMRAGVVANSQRIAAKQAAASRALMDQYGRNAAAEVSARRLGTYKAPTFNESFGYKPTGKRAPTPPQRS